MNCGYYNIRRKKKELLRLAKEYVDINEFCESTDKEIIDTLPIYYLTNIVSARQLIQEGEELLIETMQEALKHMKESKRLEERIKDEGEE